MAEVGERVEAGTSKRHSGLRLLATVTLGPNQLRAHLEPILQLPEVEQITLVSDKPGPSMPKFRTVIPRPALVRLLGRDRKSTRLNSSHEWISYAVFCLK